MTIYDPFAEYEPQPVLSDIIIQDVTTQQAVVLPVFFEFTEFQKGLILGFLIYYILSEGI